jgi:hypothetical protein
MEHSTGSDRQPQGKVNRRDALVAAGGLGLGLAT